MAQVRCVPVSWLLPPSVSTRHHFLLEHTMCHNPANSNTTRLSVWPSLCSFESFHHPSWDKVGWSHGKIFPLLTEMLGSDPLTEITTSENSVLLRMNMSQCCAMLSKRDTAWTKHWPVTRVMAARQHNSFTSIRKQEEYQHFCLRSGFSKFSNNKAFIREPYWGLRVSII